MVANMLTDTSVRGVFEPSVFLWTQNQLTGLAQGRGDENTKWIYAETTWKPGNHVLLTSEPWPDNSREKDDYQQRARQKACEDSSLWGFTPMFELCVWLCIWTLILLCIYAFTLSLRPGGDSQVKSEGFAAFCSLCNLEYTFGFHFWHTVHGLVLRKTNQYSCNPRLLLFYSIVRKSWKSFTSRD